MKWHTWIDERDQPYYEPEGVEIGWRQRGSYLEISVITLSALEAPSIYGVITTFNSAHHFPHLPSEISKILEFVETFPAPHFRDQKRTGYLYRARHTLESK